MKKLLMIMFCLLLVGCGAKESDSVTLDSAILALENDGAILEDDKPMFSLIGAVDGVMLYNDGKPVKIYKFDDSKLLKEAQKTLPGTNAKGSLLLETSHEQSIKTFNDLK